MDPLSIAVSALALLGAVGKTAKGLEKLWSLGNAPKELLGVMNETTALRLMLKTVEASLLSAGDTQNPVIQEVCQDITKIQDQVSATFVELEELVSKKLSKTDNSQSQPSQAQPRLIKIGWLRHMNDLKRLQSSLRTQTAALHAASSALGSLQIGALEARQRNLISVTIQGLTLISSGSVLEIEGPAVSSIEERLGRLLSHLTLEQNERQFQTQHLIEGPQTPPILQIGPDASENTHHEASIPTEQATTAPSSSSSPTIGLVVTSNTNTCRRFCHCHCHTFTQLRSPQWAKDVFGGIVLQSNTSILLQRKACNYKGCGKRGQATARFTYYAPSWTWLRAVHASLSRHSAFGIGASVTFAFPRQRSWTDIRRFIRIIENESVEDVRAELVSGASSIYDIDIYGESLLHIAGNFGQPQICEMLIQFGADKFYTSYEGLSAYSVGMDYVLGNPAVASNDTVAQFSAIYGKDEIYDHVNLTPLHRIVLGLNSADLEAQLGLSAKDIDMADSQGRTPIWWAAERGDIAKLKILLRWGADCNKPDVSLVTPLQNATAFGSDDCVEELLAYGAAVDAADIRGDQPIHKIFISSLYRPRTLELLLRYGADPNAPGLNGTTPLGCMVAAYDSNSSSSMRNALELIKLGADMEKTCNQGYTPVLDTLAIGDMELFDFFVGLGARLDRTTYSGRTILHLAAWHGTLEWWERLTLLARDGRLATVDVYAGHNGHDALDCMGKCRDVGKRQPRDVEIAAFTELFEAVEESVLGIASRGADELDEQVLFEDAAGDLDSTGEWLDSSSDSEQEQADKHKEVVAETEITAEEVATV